MLVDDLSGLDRRRIRAEDRQDRVDTDEERSGILPKGFFIFIVLGLEDAVSGSMARSTASGSSGTFT